MSWNIWAWSCKISVSSCISLASNFRKGKLDLLTDIDMLLMVEKGIRRGICHSIYWYAKANKYMKDDKLKESSYLQYWDLKN